MKSFLLNCGMTFAVGLLMVAITGRIADGDLTVVEASEIGEFDRCTEVMRNGKQIGCRKGFFAVKCAAPTKCRPTHKDNDVTKPMNGCKCQ